MNECASGASAYCVRGVGVGVGYLPIKRDGINGAGGVADAVGVGVSAGF